MNKLNRVRRVLSALNGATIPPFNETDKDFLKFLEITGISNTLNNYKFYQSLKNSNPAMTVEELGLVYGTTYSEEGNLPFANVLGIKEPKIDIKGLEIALLKKDSAGMHTISESLNKEYKKNETIAKIGSGLSTVFQSAGTVIGALQSANDSNLTKAATLLYNATTDVVEKMGVTGKVVGTALKNAAIAGDIMQSMGGGTDQMTTTDKWMDSPFLSWNVGAINGFGGLRADTFTTDQNTLENIGSSYGGTSAQIMNAASKSGKKYGLFSSGARKRANRAIADARNKQNLMADISDEATDQRLTVLSMGELAGLAYSIITDGGYNLKYTYAAKHGGTLEWNPEITLEWEPQIELNWELPAFKEGGQIPEELEWIPELQKGGKTRTLEELIAYAKEQNPRFIQRMSEPLRYVKINFKDDEGKDGWNHATHMMTFKDNIVYPMIQEDPRGQLFIFEDPDKALALAELNGNVLKFNSSEEAENFVRNYKQGWKDFFDKSPIGINPDSEYEEYKKNKFKLLDLYSKVRPSESFKTGGTIKDSLETPEIEETSLKNVIPEGALHKNKHHMEHAEGLTKKGIPVIDEEGEQQAEIELNEIIFTLEVTKKLEEYYEIFYSEDSTNKEKELAALEAGKLLVYEILENTDDRTGLIESCKLGGSLTLKKSTDDLIEEALEWVPNIMIIEETIKKAMEENPKKENKEKTGKELMKEAIKEVLIELLTK